MAEHTPGPWEWEPVIDPESYAEYAATIRQGRMIIARIVALEFAPDDNSGLSRPEKRARGIANARLIASAPDLLEERDRLRARVADLEDRARAAIRSLERFDPGWRKFAIDVLSAGLTPSLSPSDESAPSD